MPVEDPWTPVRGTAFAHGRPCTSVPYAASVGTWKGGGMVDGVTRTRTPRRRLKWAVVVMAAAAALALAGLLEIAERIMADDAPAGRHVGHPNTRTLVLPLLPRP